MVITVQCMVNEGDRRRIISNVVNQQRCWLDGVYGTNPANIGRRLG